MRINVCEAFPGLDIAFIDYKGVADIKFSVTDLEELVCDKWQAENGERP